VDNVSVWASEPTEAERASYAPELLVACTGTPTGPGWRYEQGQWLPPEEP
jgi:hypothetical protein